MNKSAIFCFVYFACSVAMDARPATRSEQISIVTSAAPIPHRTISKMVSLDASLAERNIRQVTGECGDSKDERIKRLSRIEPRTMQRFLSIDAADFATEKASPQGHAPGQNMAFLCETDERATEEASIDKTLITSQLTAGTSQVDVTPPAKLNATLGGYGERMSRPAEGVHDRVFVKALVISAGDTNRKFALLTADILAFPPAFKTALLKRLANDGWAVDQIMLLPSHSHTSIDLNAINPANSLGNKQMGIFDNRLYQWTLERCQLAIQQAARKQVDVVVGTTSEEMIGWNRNRRQRDGLTDKSLTVTRIDQTTGRPLAVLVTFTAHPTFMSAKQMLFSGGWPGHLQRSLERTIGKNVNVMYYNGAEGDQAPVVRPGSGDDRWKAAERYGQELSQYAHQLWTKVKPKRKVIFGYHSETFELPERRWHPDFMKTGGDEYGLSEELLQKMLPVMFPSQTASSCFRLGDLLIIGVPGEMAAELGIQIKQHAIRLSGTPHVTVGGLADAWVSYILSPEEYDRGGYEASVSFYGRNLGPRIVEGANASVQAMHATQADTGNTAEK